MCFDYVKLLNMMRYELVIM